MRFRLITIALLLPGWMLKAGQKLAKYLRSIKVKRLFSAISAFIPFTKPYSGNNYGPLITFLCLVGSNTGHAVKLDHSLHSNADTEPYAVYKEAENWEVTGGTYDGFRSYFIDNQKAINYNQSGDFADYKIHLNQGVYQVIISAGTPVKGNQTNIQFHFNGCLISTTPIKNTGSWDAFDDNTIAQTLTVSSSGMHIFRIVGWGKPGAWQWNADHIRFKLLDANIQNHTNITTNNISTCVHPPALPEKAGLSNGGIPTFYALISTIIVFILTFFSVFLFSIKTGEDTRHKLFGLFLISVALSYFDGALLMIQSLVPLHIFLFGQFSMPFDFLIGPLFLLFTYASTKPSFKLKPLHALHSIAFVLHLAFLVYNCFDFFRTFNAGGARPLFPANEITIFGLISNLHMICYISIATRLIFKYHKTSDINHTSIFKSDFSWLIAATSIFFIVILLRLTNNLWLLLAPSSHYLKIIDLNLIGTFGIFITSCIILFKGLKKSIFQPGAENKKNDKYKLNSDTAITIAEKINAHMSDNKPWLNSDFDLKTLASGIEIPAYQVSQVINQQFKMNFFDYVNSFKIKEFLKLLSDPRLQNRNITDLMYDSGFNSKSSFNTVFKKSQGVTPSQYRKKLLRKAEKFKRSVSELEPSH